MFQKLRRNLERNIFGKDPHYHDPYEDPAEQFYARIYLKYLFEKIDSEFRSRVKILDIGCHTGRLAIPLARAGHEVTAIDSSRFHIKRAEQHAQAEGVHCHFLRGDGFQKAREFPAGSFDIVLCTEVLYQRPDFRDRMRDLLQAVRLGGLFATSHRTRFFYLTRAVREQDSETARKIISHKEGELWGSYFNWQTSGELKELYDQLGTDLLLVRPIGVFTGNGEEGMAKLCNLSEVSPAEREALLDLESFDSDEFASIGRYLFAIGRKIKS